MSARRAMMIKLQDGFRIEGNRAINERTGDWFEFVGEPEAVELFPGEKWVKVYAKTGERL
jgi:hypothetical protein